MMRRAQPNEPQALRLPLATMQRLSAGLLVVGLAGLGYAAVAWIAAHPVFAIKSVRFQGDTQQVKQAVVKTMIVQQMRGTFFTANLSELKRQAESMPWVRRAQVSRAWPNEVVLTLEEHRPFARFNSDQLINTFGEIFTVNLAEVSQLQSRGLPRFSGPVAAAALMQSRYSELSAWLQPLGSPVRSLALSDRLGWTVTLDNGLVLELGRDMAPQAVQERLHGLMATWPQLLQRVGMPTRVDLRYSDGYAIQAPGLRIVQPEKKAGI
jgi:cell division protein FtsQ